jgi:hypothetical protein
MVFISISLSGGAQPPHAMHPNDTLMKASRRFMAKNAVLIVISCICPDPTPPAAGGGYGIALLSKESGITSAEDRFDIVVALPHQLKCFCRAGAMTGKQQFRTWNESDHPPGTATMTH